MARIFLTPAESDAIAARVAAFEHERGVEIVTLVVGKSDVYPETVWKAFALGAVLTALVVTVGDILRPDWTTAGAALSAVLATLGFGALCALASVYVPAFARLFLRESRATLEVGQYARVQFLERQLFATPQRTAILMVVSLLERRVVVLADTGLRSQVCAAEWDAVIARMTPHLAAGATGAAVLAGLDATSELLAGKGITRGGGNVFADQPLEEPGP
jgi:putative membrane protein